jgi:type IV pilus assembly protein PilB
MSVNTAATEQNQAVIEVLRREQILPEEQIGQLLSLQEQTGRSVLHLLREKEWIEEDRLTRLSALCNGIEYIELTPEMADPVAVKLVPLETARRHTLIPLRIEQDCLIVAMSSPLNLSVREMITTRTGYRVRPVAAGSEAIRRALQNHFNVESMTRQDIVAMRLKNKPGEEKKSQGARNQAIKSADAPVVRLVETILTGGIENRASDIHLEPQQPDMKVRYRIDGLLQDALQVPSSAERQVISHIKILADMDISEKRLPQDGHISMEHGGKLFDLRVSSLPAVGGEKIVIRILDTDTGLRTLDEQVTNPEDMQTFRTLLGNPHGMILLTGPTGCGKTTTLYSMIRSLNRTERNIVTVEDPVEYQIPGITQVQVKPDIDLTFAACLRSILRQDPDIILVGEIRDEETAEIAVSASLTGHLVLSTLHTNNAVGVVSRFVNLEVPPYQVASALLGVVSQRLVRLICQRCRTSYQPSKKENEILGLAEAAGPETLYKGAGCEYCRHTGYSGRKAVFEIFVVTPEIRHLIVQDASEDALKEEAIRQGMKTLRMQAMELVKKGQTTLDEVLRVIDMREK